MKTFTRILQSAVVATLLQGAFAQTNLLNVSYDPTRELYQEFNKSFAAKWKADTGEDVRIRQSHGDSGKQARSVLDGLEADVVTLAVGHDVEALREKGQLVPDNWKELLPDNSAPYTSTIVFVVKKGNPKGIKSWDDLSKSGVQVITPNPKTSGGARLTYLAIWGYALKKFENDEAKVREFVKAIYSNVPVLDSGARGATSTFAQRGIGDVLLTWENEAHLTLNEFKNSEFEIVVPPVSILAEPPVAVVKKYADKHKTTPVAEAYLKHLYSLEGQEIAARHYFRPRSEDVLKKYPDRFTTIELFKVDDVFGGWIQAQKTHFDDGGTFDQIYSPSSSAAAGR